VQVDSVWAPGETRPMCINASCREGTGPLPYLRLTVKAMVHLGAGILGPNAGRVWVPGFPAITAYAKPRRREVAATFMHQTAFGGRLPWRVTHGYTLNGPLRGVWECVRCGWFVDDASEDVRRSSIASAFLSTPSAGAVRSRRR
jgi:hypothetical protein